ncbi:helix-turn-helix transcriptional regulator [Streptomyces marincola]|uniref:Excisionase n=1 Tax=Streptomyces marincola TaxID=2878388 RepID=A0A1W7CWR8_9ACTN|nr:helix-turn-helix domain-containing protein [Streptomyces marincola]ARQ69157.1 excisionase [Streptomyces marincola]
MPHTDLLRLPEVLATLGISRAAFYRMRSRGQAPRLHKLPNGHIRVLRSDLDAWLAGLVDTTTT